MKFSILLVVVIVLSVAETIRTSTVDRHVECAGHRGLQTSFCGSVQGFIHPRCVNCHPAGDAPLRGEDSRPHSGLRLHRRPDGQGVYTLKCTNCHQAQNQQGLHVPPGAPNVLNDGSLDQTTPRWHLPPAETPMIFQGRSASQLCRQLQDSRQNGGLTPERLLHHVSTVNVIVHCR